jgi:membrane protein CcdC involved in cytochrome C biogenesis
LAGGLTSRVYGAALVLLTLVAIAMAGLLIRAVAVGEWAGVLFLAGFIALFAWQVGGFVERNRPLAYSFDRLPNALLP